MLFLLVFWFILSQEVFFIIFLIIFFIIWYNINEIFLMRFIMYPNLFGIEFLDSYAIMTCLGIIAFAAVFFYKLKINRVDNRMKEDLFLICVISGCLMYVGAFLFDSLFHSIEEGKIVRGGITYLGGFVTAIGAFILLFRCIIKREKNNVLYFLNIIVVGLTIAHCFGRIGCFLSGCCFGKDTNSIFGVTFPIGSQAWWQGHYGKVLPTQLFEAIFLLILFVVLFFMKKNQFKVYLLAYGIFRFILEFFRGDDRGKLFKFLSPSQCICLILIVVGIVLFIINPNQERIIPEEEKPLKEAY